MPECHSTKYARPEPRRNSAILPAGCRTGKSVYVNPKYMKPARKSNRPMPINILAGAGAVLLLV